MGKSPEYYKKVGYEDHDYVSPELSGSDTYQEYIKNEVIECVRKIQQYQSEQTFTFGFMTEMCPISSQVIQ